MKVVIIIIIIDWNMLDTLSYLFFVVVINAIKNSNAQVNVMNKLLVIIQVLLHIV